MAARPRTIWSSLNLHRGRHFLRLTSISSKTIELATGKLIKLINWESIDDGTGHRLDSAFHHLRTKLDHSRVGLRIVVCSQRRMDEGEVGHSREQSILFRCNIGCSIRYGRPRVRRGERKGRSSLARGLGMIYQIRL